MYRENIELFPVLINVYKNFLNEEQCDSIVELCRQLKFNEHGLIENGVSNYINSQSSDDFMLNKIEKNISNCKDISQRIFKESLLFAKEYKIILSSNKESIHSWINIQYKNSTLKEHTHYSNSKVSGAIYIKVDELSSSLYFYNPNPYIKIMPDIYQSDSEELYNKYKSWWYSLKPKNGDLIIFPSWLPHGSNGEKNMSDERIVLSFNIT